MFGLGVFAEGVDVGVADFGQDGFGDFGLGVDDDGVVIYFGDLRTVNQEVGIVEALEERPADAKLLDDEAAGVDDVVVDFAEFVAFFVEDGHTGGHEMELVDFVEFDDVTGGDEFVAGIDDEADVAKFAHVGDAQKRWLVG